MSIALIREYGKLARIHSAVLSGLAPVLGALSVGYLELDVISILFLVGFCTHIFGFVFNEYMDIDIDKRSKLLKDKPLVKGTISKSAALLFAYSAIILGYLLLGYLMMLQHAIAWFALIFYTIAWSSIGIYDLTSKYARGSDVFLALWTGSLCLFGGFAVTSSPPYLLFIIAALAFLQLFVQNILAGLKDLAQDKLGSGTSTPLRMGAVVRSRRLKVPWKFQVLIYGFKIIHLFFVFIPFIFYWLGFNLVQIFLTFLLLLINFLLVFRMFNSPVYNRNNLMRLIGLHELLSYSVVPIMFLGIIDVPTIFFLLIFPVVWLAVVMKLLYGRLLPGI